MADFTNILNGILMAIYAMFSLDEEQCSRRWTEPDFQGLRRDLSEKVYGQHIASEMVPFLLERHRRNNADGPLLLGFHGMSGVGKTLVSSLIAEHLYKRGTKSKFVVMFYYQSSGDPEFYKFQIIRKIQETVEICSLSLFIFDESDKMPARLLDQIQHYLERNTRSSISFFLSNVGGERIAQVAMQHRQIGRSRNSLTVSDIQRDIKMTEWNIADVVVVPFLPLERQHVKQCIRFNAKTKRRYPSEETINIIADELEYFPSDIQVYSRSGCKRVDEKVNLYTTPEF